MMRIVRLMVGVMLLLLLTAHCRPEQEPRKAESSHRESAGTASIDSEKSLTEQAFDLVASLGNDAGWKFHVSDGENGLAFAHGWPDEVGVWDIGSFKGTEPPDLLDMNFGPLASFRVASLENIRPLETDALIPDLAAPARTAISVANSTLADESALSQELEEEEMRALQAVAEGRLEVASDLQRAFGIAQRKLYRGNDAYAEYRSGSFLNHYGTASLILIPDGFIVSWGPTLGGEVALYYDGESFNAIPHAKRDNPVPLEEAQKRCAENISKLAAIVDAAKLSDKRQVAELNSAADVLSTHVPKVQGKRLWMFVDELYEQLVAGQGLSPPRQWSDRDPSPLPSEVEMQCGNVQVKFFDFEDWNWSCILDDGQRKTLLGPGLNGLVSPIVTEKNGLLSSIRCLVSDAVLARNPTPDIEEAVNAASRIARDVIASDEAANKLNKECFNALARVAERKVSVLSPSIVTTTFLEQVRGAGDEMMYWMAVPRANGGQVHFRATSRIATLDFIPEPLALRRHQDIGYQVRLEGGRIFLDTSEESTSSRISTKVKDAVASISRMRDGGLLHVPDFARGMVDEFAMSVSKAKKYDSVTVKPLGEIAELTVGRG